MTELKISDIEQVTIPIPQQFERHYGVHATTHNEAERKTQRYSKQQHDEIIKAASALGITVAAFIKESAYNMAKAINLKVEKHNAKHDLRSG